MRYLLGLFSGLFFLFECQAQTDTTFVNELGTYVSREQANYYRLIIATEKNTYLFTDYFFNHQLARSVEYKSKMGTIREGNAIYFFSNGIKKEEGRFANGFQIGEWNYYFTNETLKEKKIFNEKLHAYYSYEYDSTTNKLEEEGAYDNFGKKTGTWKRYFWNSEILQNRNNYLVGKKEGEQVEYYKSGAIKRNEIFEKNKLKKGFQYDLQGNKIAYFPAFEYPISKKPIYRILQNQIPCYAEQLTLHPFEIRFLVTKEGDVKNIEIDIEDETCKTEMKKVIEKMKWKPAKKENKPIDFYSSFRMRTYGNGD
jgi:antitoxin component YwqK of YwqJK toxin-antitoxin module